jgi:hypothetical protein
MTKPVNPISGLALVEKPGDGLGVEPSLSLLNWPLLHTGENSVDEAAADWSMGLVERFANSVPEVLEQFEMAYLADVVLQALLSVGFQLTDRYGPEVAGWYADMLASHVEDLARLDWVALKQEFWRYGRG